MNVRAVMMGLAGVCAVGLGVASAAWACSASLTVLDASGKPVAKDQVVRPGQSLGLSVTGATADVEVRWDHQDTGLLLAAFSAPAVVTATGQPVPYAFTITIPATASAGFHYVQTNGYALDSTGKRV